MTDDGNAIAAERERARRENERQGVLSGGGGDFVPNADDETDAEKRARLGLMPGPSPFGRGAGGGVFWPRGEQEGGHDE